MVLLTTCSDDRRKNPTECIDVRRCDMPLNDGGGLIGSCNFDGESLVYIQYTRVEARDMNDPPLHNFLHDKVVFRSSIEQKGMEIIAPNRLESAIILIAVSYFVLKLQFCNATGSSLHSFLVLVFRWVP
jgi:hypothetical protein